VSGAPNRPLYFFDRVARWLDAPEPVLRLELVRVLAPLAILGFLSSRIAHADEWLGDAGFRVPELATSDYRQPLYLPALPSWAAWSVAGLIVLSGLAIALGYQARRAALVFAATCAFAALSDRLAAFSVSKMAPMVAVALAVSPCGRRFSLDAVLARRRSPGKKLPRKVASGSVRFFQVLLPVIYSASGIAKARGDWLSHPHVLWTHVHDSYQTAFTVFVANTLPAGAWGPLQYAVLAFEAGAPLWFAWSRSRPVALAFGVGMHAMIGLMFGPVRWFALLMATLLVASFAPAPLLERLERRGRRLF
jgi:uncharacterized membrane protein YphA (DoxX/SURF4 family)